MDGKPLAVSVPCTGRKCQYLVTGLRLYSCINIGIFYHLVDKFLVFFPRLITDFIYIAANYCIFIGEDLFAQIFFVVPGVHDRIVDANLILIVEPYPADDVRVFCF